MARQGQPKPFEPRGSRKPAKATAKSSISPKASGSAKASRGQQAIPEMVANRMARRIAIATGIPSALGMGVFVASYFLVSRGVVDIAPALTLVTSGAFFLLGLVGLSYGVLSSSWEDVPGSLLGLEQIRVNLGRLRQSVRAMRQGSPAE
ncbi:PAM68 family protein [Synechococcus sp. CCY9201]|jgi:hypothetical protein|uniref:PAM68 family protein n=1 Tax=unclassified Synechococcus TaxID=2626047 RepID=UPI0018CCAE81|nr:MULTISPECIES: PAM68 family protein [unclassified Synechococcus]MEA5472721.1 PAM68 family protein [Synechococcus sp. CCY9201]QPN59241.1 PAM68 family protein [Synechococcus sp. CBW1002]QPN66032.1 PAM68 family protein [Synechococcus sp. CBW1006]CAK6696299.1 hypothetical protein IFHNHDMJ_01997 [Synechococcus sp. CBW1107]